MFDMNRKPLGKKEKTSIDRCPLLLQVICHVKQPRHDTIKGYQFSGTGYKIISFTKLLSLSTFSVYFYFQALKFVFTQMFVWYEAL